MLGFGLDIPTCARMPQTTDGGGGTPAVDFGTDFVMVAATTATNETFTIPCRPVGTYAAAVDWGDGTTSTIAAYNDTNLTHTYTAAGDHVIRISGSFPAPSFNNGGDKLKVTRVIQLGHVGLIQLVNTFYGCANLTEFSSGVCDTSNVNNMSGLLQNSGVVIPDVSSMSTATVTRMAYALRSSTITDIVGLENFEFYSLSYAYSLKLLMHGATLPTSRYDQVLINWAAQDLSTRPAQAPSFGSAKYTPGGAAEAARTHLIGTYGWTITDGGPA